jgi:hypothetical protein
VQRHLSLTLSRERERTQDVPAQKLIFRKQKQKGPASGGRALLRVTELPHRDRFGARG